MVLPAEARSHIRCFTDQVKLIHALVRDLDKVMKEIKELGEHREEASQRSLSWKPFTSIMQKPPRSRGKKMPH
jgi:hypothetical protein